MSDALRIAYGSFGRVALLDMDRPLVRHAHPHCHVLIKVEGADSNFAVGNSIAPLTDTTAVLVNGWEPHSYIHEPNRPRTLILALYIEPEWLNEFRSGWAASGAPGFFAQPCVTLPANIRGLARDLATDMMTRPNATKSHEELLAKLMIAVIERFTEWRGQSAISIRSLSSSVPVDWRIRKAVNTLREGDFAAIDVNSLARSVGLSRAHFFRLFESNTNVSPYVYFNVVRVEAAVAATVGGNESFSSIGERLGFSAPTHFTRFFKDHLGVSPSEFRQVSRSSTDL